MAIEPERPIEKLLRACAQKRREEAGVPLELHPATRRLLQGEVSRQFGREERRRAAGSPGLAGLWQRFAWGAAIFAVLVLVALLLVPGSDLGRKEAQFARNEHVPEVSVAKQLAPLPAAAPASVPPDRAPQEPGLISAKAERVPSGREQAARQLGAGQADRAKLRTEEYAVATAPAAFDAPAPSPSKDVEQPVAPVVVPVAKPPPAPSAAPEAAVFSRRYGLVADASNTAPGAPAAPAPRATSVAAEDKALAMDELRQAPVPANARSEFADQAQSSAAQAKRAAPSTVATKQFSGSLTASARDGSRPDITQHFAQVAQDRKAKAILTDSAASAKAVLASFQVEQSGSELRVVDGDGSVYRGVVESAENGERLRSAKRGEASGARADRMSAAQPAPAAALPAGASSQAGHTYFFRVSGTNRSLNKQVVFTGNLLSATNLALVTQLTNAWKQKPGIGGSLAETAPQTPQPLRDARISGKAVIGSGKAIEINAAASP